MPRSSKAPEWAAIVPAGPDRAARSGRPWRNSILAVLPRSSFRRVGSCSPGTWTRMRSAPCRWITGSTVPSSLTRFSTIWIDCSIVCRTRSVIAACGIPVTVAGLARIAARPIGAERADAGGRAVHADGGTVLGHDRSVERRLRAARHDHVAVAAVAGMRRAPRCIVTERRARQDIGARRSAARAIDVATKQAALVDRCHDSAHARLQRFRQRRLQARHFERAGLDDVRQRRHRDRWRRRRRRARGKDQESDPCETTHGPRLSPLSIATR